MNRTFEAALGAIVLLGFGLFLWMLVQGVGGSSADTNRFIAIFNQVDGLSSGDDVRIGGVKVGQVADIEVDPKSLEVLVHMDVDSLFALAQNARASILADGLLGGAFVDLKVGRGAPLAEGGYIENTNDALNLTSLLSQVIYGATGGND